MIIKDNNIDNVNNNEIMRQVAALALLSEDELKEKWRTLYDCDSPEFRYSFLVKRLAYRIQEIYYGDLKPEVRAHLEKLATPAHKRARISARRAPRAALLASKNYGLRFYRDIR